MKSCIIILLLSTLTSISFPQNYSNIPLNIRPAYKKDTRSLNGKPGSNYWQNHAEYNIKVNLDPALKLLEGSGDIIYYNNSPDTLTQIVVRLYQNISKSTARRDFYLNEEAISDGVKLKKIVIDNMSVNINDRTIVRVSGTNLFLKLNDTLAPKTSLKLSFEWDILIPKVETLRFGYYDSTSMFVAYWYPQISVYDDVDGWDRLDYTGLSEMYNDFNDYNVSFTVPVGYQIWATGVWQNPDEILNEKYLERYKLAWTSDDVVRIFETSDLKSNEIYRSKDDFNTFVFNALSVPDFAFGISDHYLWDAVSFRPDKISEKRVYCTAAYKEASKDFVDVAWYAKESLKYFSNEMPGIPFPFPSATVFNGSGGMEFPMIVNNGSSDTKAGTVHLTSHELCHQYLPFYMGTNERKYPFMDEGWAVMLPFDFQERIADGYTPRANVIKAFEKFAGDEYDLPLMIPSPIINWQSYRTSAYNKPAIAYDLLRQTLGDTLFLTAMQIYMQRWNGKHPIPTDFFFTFNDVIGKDLSWFWKPWFYNFSYPDLAIKSVMSDNNYITVKVTNNGGLPLPVKLQVMYDDKVIKEVFKNTDFWKNGNSDQEIKIDGIKNFDAIILGSSLIPDVNSVDNVYFK